MTLRIDPAPGEDGPDKARSVSRTKLRVRFAETDLMGIVHHANYLVYFELARVDFLRRRGGVFDAWAARGVHFPVVDARVRYKKAARFDEELEIDCWVGEASRVLVRFDYAISRSGDRLDLPERIAAGYTTVACVDNQTRPRRIPEDIFAQMTGPELAP